MKIIILQDPPPQIMDFLRSYEVVEELPTQEEVNRSGFTKLLLLKGYKAKSHKTIVSLCERYSIVPVKHNRKMWYKVKDIANIPDNT